MLLTRLKDACRQVPWIVDPWRALCRERMHRDYRRRREYYAGLIRDRGLVCRESEVVGQIRQRMADRGYSPTVRKPGEIHTFTFVPRRSWHPTLFPDLYELGPVSEFDYAAHGYRVSQFRTCGARGVRRRQEMNDMVLPALRKAHAERPVDWMFVYARGEEIQADVLRTVVDELGIPVVNMCFDDKQSWAGPVFGGQRTGQIDIASAFDLSWTSSRMACDWYLAEGARPIYLPEGFDRNAYRPLPVDRDIPVSFIGAGYGCRPPIVRYLRRNKIPIRVYGSLWNTRWVSFDEQVEIFNRSQINLGIGGILTSEELTNVKGRDFEVPATGGGLYLTTFNPDLAQHFDIGREIVCYRTRDEMVELIRHYLAHPEEAREIARRGRQRCLAEHRWLHRYARVCRILGILPAETAGAEPDLRLAEQPPTEYGEPDRLTARSA
ncbi:MAG: glycosyltransferase [Candidatus Nealsonbacteria bacterium]|nr:glycosyltransferase [Candidatus Nealsonbacteria bacterium]